MPPLDSRKTLSASLTDRELRGVGEDSVDQQFMLEQLLDHIAHLEEQLAAFSARIEESLRPFVDEVTFNRGAWPEPPSH